MFGRRIPFTLLLSLAIVPLCYSQASPADIHIEVIVKPSSAHYPPRLGSSSFKVFQQGRRIPIQLARTAKTYPANLLIVTASPLAGCAAFDTAPELKHLIEGGWNIRIADTSGAVTAPLSAANSSSQACASAAVSGPSDPITALSYQPGRRVIVFTTPEEATSMIALLKRVPEVYTVDGGLNLTQFDQIQPVYSSSRYGLGAVGPWPCVPPPPSAVPGTRCDDIGTQVTYRSNGPRNGVLHEKNLESALGDLLHASGRYWDLSFTLPTSQLASAPLQLFLHAGGRLPATVIEYAVKSQPNSTRDTVPSRLFVTER